MERRILFSTATLLCGMALSSPVWADDPGPGGGGINIVAEAKTGAQIYATVCQGCHMADAKGAMGAGRIPPLAGSPVVGSADYVLTMIIKGRGAMPALGDVLTDDQILKVTSYVRTHFGNSFKEDPNEQQIKEIKNSDIK
ncbi:c-type cytochrome [Acetobacter senegalensis]|uniref:c-type cytochrome n=1 Tax=Acetobacter senegalensis TaxID=446692 RepID=UPI0026532121|nr:cytochrome c [Acetobacter senegalensis]MDN7356254.1 cytochrome c [Acetobacter senegalensis]